MRRRRFLQAGAVAGLATVTGLATEACSRNQPPPKASGAAWQDLANHLRGRVLRPGDAQFDEFTRPINRRFQSRPAGVAVCAGPEDVAYALKWSEENDIARVPRSGGHSFMGYSSNDGLVISLDGMKSVSYQPDSNRVVAAGGAQNRDASKALRPSNVMIAGGQCPTVGLAGLTLGGGLGFSMRLLGMTSDTMLSTQVVLANGNIVTASGEENPDLYWAMRGGTGGNFGINTEFTYTAFPAQDCTHFSVDFPAERTADILDAWFTMVENAPRELGVMWYFEPGSTPSTAPYCGTWGLMYGSESETRDLLAPVMAAGGKPLDQLFKQASYWDAANFLAEGDSAPHGYLERSRFLERRLSADGVATLTSRLVQNPQNAVSTTIFAWGGAIRDTRAEASAFVHREPVALIKYSASWKPGDRETESNASRWVDDTFQAMQPHSSHRSFQNFPDGKLEDWAVAYFGENLDRLKEIKHRYDPERLFNFPQAIPKL
jgi:FAD/FMN-containing dehydrogenase